jgi:hypothetical protein
MSVDTDRPFTFTDDEMAEMHRPSWLDGLPAILVTALAAVAVAAMAAVGYGAVTRTAPALTRSHWTEPDGRHCTATQAGEAVALSCEYPPAENRIGHALGLTR